MEQDRQQRTGNSISHRRQPENTVWTCMSRNRLTLGSGAATTRGSPQTRTDRSDSKPAFSDRPSGNPSASYNLPHRELQQTSGNGRSGTQRGIARRAGRIIPDPLDFRSHFDFEVLPRLGKGMPTEPTAGIGSTVEQRPPVGLNKIQKHRPEFQRGDLTSHTQTHSD
jgi:hypothetical protein